MASYHELSVYQIAHQWGIDAHRFTLTLPKYELYETGSQLRRSAKSVSANIVEGYGRRRSKAEFVKFLIYAHASCDETMEWLMYIKDCHPSYTQEAERLLQQGQALGRKLYRFIEAVETGHLSTR